MISVPTLADRDLALQTAQRFTAVSAAALDPVLNAVRCCTLSAGDVLWHMGQAPALECFVLRGLVHTFAVDSEGHEVTMGFYPGPSVVSPSITRSDHGVSRVSCVALEDTRVAVFDPEVLSQAMITDGTIREWGNAVLRQELLRISQREWMLAVQSGAQRLQHLRQALPGLEDRVAHRHIASYLGLTPVSLSRLRRQTRSH